MHEHYLERYGAYLVVQCIHIRETQPGPKANGYVMLPNNTANINRGQGFFYFYSNYGGGQNFPRQIPVTGSLSFQTPFVFPVTYTPSAGPANDGWNLIGNPYPGTINWNSGWTKLHVNNAIYTWNTCSKLYASYVNYVATNGGSKFIHEYQGFWVQTNHSNPVLKVTSSSIKVKKPALLIPLQADTIPMALHIYLGSDEIAVRLDSNATNGFDTLFDARAQLTDSSRLYSFVNGDTTNEEYAVNAVYDSNQTIPFAVKGSGTLTFSGLSSLSGITVYLKDIQNATTVVIDSALQYTYIQPPALDTVFNNRFELIFKKSLLSVQPVVNQPGAALWPCPSNGHLFARVMHPGIISIYDMGGNAVFTHSLASGNNSLCFSIPSGAYTARIMNTDNKLIYQCKIVVLNSGQ